MENTNETQAAGGVTAEAASLTVQWVAKKEKETSEFLTFFALLALPNQLHGLGHVFAKLCASENVKQITQMSSRPEQDEA